MFYVGCLDGFEQNVWSDIDNTKRTHIQVFLPSAVLNRYCKRKAQMNCVISAVRFYLHVVLKTGITVTGITTKQVNMFCPVQLSFDDLFLEPAGCVLVTALTTILNKGRGGSSSRSPSDYGSRVPGFDSRCR